MKKVRVRLVATVAGLTVAAAILGGTLAFRQVPRPSFSAAGPLSKAPATPPSTEQKTPTPASGTAATPPEVKVDLARLPLGRGPQMAYLVDRTVRGGTGPVAVVPGKQPITDVVRFGGGLLVMLSSGDFTSELRRLEPYGETFSPGRVTGVTSLVGSPEEDLAAYAVEGKGAVHWVDSRDSELVQRSLQRPEFGRTQVLAVRGDVVHFGAEGKGYPAPETYYRWDSKTGQVTAVKTVHSLEGLNTAGTAAADYLSGAAQTFCSAVTELATGKQRFRTCDYSLDGFTPDGRTVVASEDFRGGGAEPLAAALDSTTGHIRRQWVGPEFVMAVAEDDDHLLMVVDSGEQTPVGIIRCSIATGTCEAALPLDRYGRDNVRLLGART
ncbi:hypothetical protein [Kribbella sp. ALI-6-A]|uniref:hypothetical protein n=1 Tax=Kribbella sp. ALI-6-A TaxID=1933817 RepID=UPI00117AA1C6|nr:hypothetical protein [Kribbella sp. ALI-6-A]